MADAMHLNRHLALLLVLSLQVAGCAPSGELNTRITGDSAGPECDRVAIGVTRYQLRYPWLAGMGGWGRGVPKVQDMVGEIYLYWTDTGALQRIVSMPAPSRWEEDTTRFAISPRLLADDDLIFMLRGCPAENQNCQEARYFRLAQNGEYSEMSRWPDVSKEESENLRRCTTYLTSKGGTTIVNIGPTGGPWRPLLGFSDNALAPLQEAADSVRMLNDAH
ncbi:MAG: hypothetical protein R3F42_07940 [Pseudomonadota bacterium]